MARTRKMFDKRDQHREDGLYRRERRFTIVSRRRISRNTLDRLSRVLLDVFRSHRLLPCLVIFPLYPHVVLTRYAIFLVAPVPLINPSVKITATRLRLYDRHSLAAA